jgi:hypothetical protein
VVKLFRDHGAERKSSNDKTHARKRIEELNKQIVVQERVVATLSIKVRACHFVDNLFVELLNPFSGMCLVTNKLSTK